MADENDKDSNAKPSASAKHNSGAADLEKVTDYAEEKEISAGDDLNNAINVISDKRKQEADLKEAKERQLASVKVKKEDVELILNEFEITKMRAERVLKEHNGDLSAALTSLIA